MITNGCNETEMDGTTAELAITFILPESGVALFTFKADVEAVSCDLLVDASPALLSLSTSIFSFLAVTGILFLQIPITLMEIIKN